MIRPPPRSTLFPPTTLCRSSDATIECPLTPSFHPPTASDTCSGATVVNDGDSTQAGASHDDNAVTRSWHAADACCNTSAQVHQTITVEDSTLPTISGQGSDA